MDNEDDVRYWLDEVAEQCRYENPLLSVFLKELSEALYDDAKGWHKFVSDWLDMKKCKKRTDDVVLAMAKTMIDKSLPTQDKKESDIKTDKSK